MFINGTDLKLQLNTSTNVVPSKSDGGNQLNWNKLHEYQKTENYNTR